MSVFYGEKQAIRDVSIDVTVENATAVGRSGRGRSSSPLNANRMNDMPAAARIEESIQQRLGRYAMMFMIHNMEQAIHISQRTVFSHLGHLVEYGDASEIFIDPRDTRTKDYTTGRYG